MLKRISVDQLKTGMFLHEICGSWLDHPFWRSKFLLEGERDLQSLRNSSVREVWIDTARGLDVDNGDAVEPAEAAAEIDAVLIRVSDQAAPAEPVDIAQEIAKAAQICSQAKVAVSSMFNEARMGKALDAADAMPLVEDITNSVSRNPGALISLARLKTKDDYTYMHSVAVCALMVSLARQLGMNESEVRQAGMAGLLHDIGKMTIPLDILNKPGRLSDEEFLSVKNHPLEGHRMLLEGRGVDAVALDVCLHHHEKIDGSGYPHGLKDAEISLFAKMGAVCDVYDAITSNRPYKDGWDPAESLRKMAEWSKGHFDPLIFQAFVKSVGIYPIGSLVRLESGLIGVVIDQTADSLLSPKVKVFFSSKSQVRITPEVLDLSQARIKDKIVAREDPDDWHFTDLNDLWGAVTVF